MQTKILKLNVNSCSEQTTNRRNRTYNFFSFFNVVNSPVGIVWIRFWFNFSSCSCVSVSNERRSSRFIWLLFKFLRNHNKYIQKKMLLLLNEYDTLRFGSESSNYRQTYNFCRAFPLKNVFGAIVWIELRLKSKWVSCGNATSASAEISWIPLPDNSRVWSDTSPTNNGTWVNLFWFKCKSIKLFRFWMDVTQRSSSMLLWDNSLLEWGG